MFFSKLATAAVATLLAVPAVFAQTTHNVVVGASGLTFSPNQVTAAVGDVVTFEFHPKNHTLTQSTFANPCTAMPGGADSGFMPVAATATTFPVFSFRINEVTPLWFYCAQANHCQSGMVMAINVNASSPNTFDAFLAKATGSASTGPSVTASGSSAVVSATGTATDSSAATASSAAAGATSGTASNSASGKAAGNGAGRLASVSVASFALTAVGVLAGLAL